MKPDAIGQEIVAFNRAAIGLNPQQFLAQSGTTYLPAVAGSQIYTASSLSTGR